MMKKRIIVLTEGNIYERRGFFNAVVSRTKHLKNITDYEIDVLLLSSYSPWYVRLLRHAEKYEKPKTVNIEGLNIKIDWKSFSLIDYILHYKLNKPEVFSKLHNNKIVKYLKGYDMIIAHSTNCGLIAKQAKELYGTPYTVTWHGSDIHSEPFSHSSSLKPTKDVIEAADMNFFVSKALMSTSEQLTTRCEKMVLYNGYNVMFKEYMEDQRVALRQKYGVERKKVVVFAGNFLAIKNILTIPLIFKAISEKIQNVECWMIGGGKYRQQVEEMVKGLPVRLWGNQEPEAMPDFFNASDVLILPSVNEGLPLTVVEGLASGCNVVGSLVGGIPEVIGEGNCVDLKDPDFVKKFADKVIAFLKAEPKIKQPLDSNFNWNQTAKKELEVIHKILR